MQLQSDILIKNFVEFFTVDIPKKFNEIKTNVKTAIGNFVDNVVDTIISITTSISSCIR